MRIALLQLNPIVGDISGNAERIENAVRKAADMGADLCVSTEMALTGYPPRDLLLYQSFVYNCTTTAESLAKKLADAPPVLLGSVIPHTARDGRPLHNCALLLEKGSVTAAVGKTLLPTYDVFDEDRYFEPWTGDKVLAISGRRVAVTICEDIWNDKEFWVNPRYSRDPLEALMAQKPDLLVNLSASPFSLGKQQVREKMLSGIAAKYATPLVYCNQYGGNDDLIFDGRSLAFTAHGELAARARAFDEDILLVDFGADNRIEADDSSPEAEAFGALVTGTRDYLHKSGFQKAVIGLSGGIDSALTAAVAAHALGRENVLCVLMPSPYSSQGSIDDSIRLAENIGVKTLTLPIETAMNAFESTLAEAFKGYAPDVTEENIQSRIRGNLLMALSNKYGALLLTTGNKSELAVGYCTIYGDMAGALAVIADLPKTLVYGLSRWMNERFGPTIPAEIIDKEPSAELRPDQRDQDSLPPYDVLDRILHLHIEEYKSTEEIIAEGFDPDVVRKVIRLVTIAEFKRRQAAPGIKVSSRAFGTGWRMPLACRRPL